MLETLVYRCDDGIVRQEVVDLVEMEGPHGKLHTPTIQKTFALDFMQLNGSVPVAVDDLTLYTFQVNASVEVTGTPRMTGNVGWSFWVNVQLSCDRTWAVYCLISTPEPATLLHLACPPRTDPLPASAVAVQNVPLLPLPSRGLGLAGRAGGGQQGTGAGAGEASGIALQGWTLDMATVTSSWHPT